MIIRFLLYIFFHRLDGVGTRTWRRRCFLQVCTPRSWRRRDFWFIADVCRAFTARAWRVRSWTHERGWVGPWRPSAQGEDRAEKYPPRRARYVLLFSYVLIDTVLRPRVVYHLYTMYNNVQVFQRVGPLFLSHSLSLTNDIFHKNRTETELELI